MFLTLRLDLKGTFLAEITGLTRNSKCLEDGNWTMVGTHEKAK